MSAVAAKLAAGVNEWNNWRRMEKNAVVRMEDLSFKGNDFKGLQFFIR
jgi:hypothetical protein